MISTSTGRVVLVTKTTWIRIYIKYIIKQFTMTAHHILVFIYSLLGAYAYTDSIGTYTTKELCANDVKIENLKSKKGDHL
mgnify:CR=1 FL=1